MLFGKAKSVRTRIVTILVSLVVVTTIGIALAGVGAASGLWEWPPQPSSPLGVSLGFIAAGIVLFEMAILPRKWLRGKRLGATRVWMRWHVWLGLVGLPVVLVHAGFGFGGPLTTTTLALFLAVTFSGVWGLVMQQWLPGKMLAELPGEAVASEIDFLGDYHVEEARRLVAGLVSAPPETRATPLVSGSPADELLAFQNEVLLPYLRAGGPSPLASRSEADQRFARLRAAVPEPARPAVERLRELADLRRQWDRLTRLHFWLHNWLLLHLPLSVAMTVLMGLHAVRALKYW